MPEIKSLNDFYDPTKTLAVGLQYMQGQQHLALQAQQVQQQQANQEIDNLKQAAQVAITENPSQAAPVYNAYMKRIGGPQVTDSNAFSAQPQHFWDQLNYPPDSQEWKDATQAIDNMGVTTRKRSREEFERQGMLAGAGEAITAAGGKATPAGMSFVAQSEQTQREIAEATYDPHKQAEAAANKQTMAEQAGIHAELNPLLDWGVETRRGVKELAKVTPKIAAAQANYEKDLQSNKGRERAVGTRREALAGDPDVAKYLTNATASVPKIEEALAQVNQQIDETTKAAHHLFAGTKPQTTDDSLPISVGSMRALEMRAEYLEASLALAKDPMNPAKHAAVSQVVQKMDARAGELYQAKTSLSVRHDAQMEAARVNAAKEQRVANIGNAQAAWREAGSKPGDAYKFAKQFGVLEQEVTEATKDWNRPASSNVVNVSTDPTAVHEYIKEARVTFNQLKQTPILLENIEKVKELIPQAKGFMGPAGESLLEATKFLNNRLGMSIDVAGVKGAEEVRTRIFFNLMDNLKKVDAQPSQMQQLIMQDSLGKLGTDPNALGNMLDAYGDALRGKVELYNTEVEGAIKKGTQFPYDPVIKLRPKGEARAAAPATMTPGVPQFHDPEKQKRYDEWKQKHKP